MPKIAGANIADHVAAQEEAIFVAATRLFAEHGVNQVGIATIAESVGLARSSLYRYFPTKSSIVHRWFETAMAPLIEQSLLVAQSSRSAEDRLAEWVGLQLDFLADADNQAMIQASLETDDMPHEQRQAIGRRHRDLYASLHDIIKGAGITPETTNARVLIIAGAVRGIGELLRSGIPEELARLELHRTCILTARAGNSILMQSV